MKKVLLAGDSWGYGAGYIYYNGVEGPGNLTAEAFTEYDFTNVSRRGGLNSESVQNIKDCLAQTDYDSIFWIQTDPMRELTLVFLEWEETSPGNGRYASLSAYGAKVCSTQNLIKLMEQLLSESYSALNKIAADHNKKIHCLGGCSMLHPSISEHKNLIPIIPSIMQFLVPSFKEDSIVYESQWFRQIIEHADAHEVNQTFSDNLRELVEVYYPKQAFMGQAPHFQEDSHHPDPAGLRLWAAECKKYI